MSLRYSHMHCLWKQLADWCFNICEHMLCIMMKLGYELKIPKGWTHCNMWKKEILIKLIYTSNFIIHGLKYINSQIIMKKPENYCNSSFKTSTLYISCIEQHIAQKARATSVPGVTQTRRKQEWIKNRFHTN